MADVQDLCLTWNNPEVDLDQAFSALMKKINPSFLILQEEWGEEAGTHHFQGYVQFERARRWEKLQKQLSPIHMERRAAPTAYEAARYCSAAAVKTGRKGRSIEHGEFKELGKMNKSSLFARMAEIMPWHDFLVWAKQCDAGFLMMNMKKVREYADSQRQRKPRAPHYAEYHFGDTGAGKSHACRLLAGPDRYTFAKSANGAFYLGGYNDQATMICEESDIVPYEHFLQILDDGECNVNICGAFRSIGIEKSYLCGHRWPSAVAAQVPAGQDLMRRIHLWVYHWREPDGAYKSASFPGGGAR